MCSTMYAGDITRTVLISTLPPSSLSALFCGKKNQKNLHICSSDAVHLGRLVHECALWSPDSSAPIAVFLSVLSQHSLDVLAAA